MSKVLHDLNLHHHHYHSMVPYLLHVVFGILVLKLELLNRNRLHSIHLAWVSSVSHLSDDAEGALADGAEYFEFFFELSLLRLGLLIISFRGCSNYRFDCLEIYCSLLFIIGAAKTIWI
jgi:hypothetical protein